MAAIEPGELAAAEQLARFGRWRWQAGSRTVDLSDGLRRILGVADISTSGRELCRRLPRQQRVRLFAAIRAAAGGGDAAQLELEVPAGDDAQHLLVSIDAASGAAPLLHGICHDQTPMRRAEAELVRSESRWEAALERAGQSAWDSDLVTGKVHHSRTWRLVRGIDEDSEEDTHDAWLTRVHPDDLPHILEQIRRQHSGEVKRVSFEYRERHRDGHYIWISSLGGPVEWFPDGRPKRILGVDTDITARKEAEERLARLSQRLELALHTSRIGVFESNLETGELFWDDRMREMYGKPRDGSPMGPTEWEAMLHPEDSEQAQRAVGDAITHQCGYSSQFRIILPDGEVRTMRTNGAFYRDSRGTPYMLGANWDVTEEVAAKRELELARDLAEARNVELEATRARIEHNSLHDMLTGLPNRRYLERVLAERAEACAGGGDGVGVLHVDLDRFKQINDTLGHVAGDAILAHVARLLRDSAEGEDFVARVGGDEFIVVCHHTGDWHRLGSLAERIVSELRRPVPYEGHYCRFGASVGIAAHMGGAVDPKRLLIDADIALYRAKAHGKNRYEFFSDALQAEAISAKRTGDDIMRGIEQNEFVPFYQPIFNARDMSLAGVEALVRWQHPEHGVLPPSAFLQIAEDINVVTAIDRQILERSLRDLEGWEASGHAVPSVAVNVSFRRLHDERLMSNLRSLRIRPGVLSFELVESIFLDEPDDIIGWNIEHIRGLGIGINIDDFGTGHASIIGLVRLRPDRVKIDRQFLAEITTSSAQRRLVRSLIDIGKSLDIKVVAEGVETAEQAKVLTALGCDMLQGFLFARPMPARELGAFLDAQSWRRAS